MKRKYVTKCRRPKMSHHRGRTWDVCIVIDVDGVEITGYMDTTWGECFYFSRDGIQWYRGDMRDFEYKERHLVNLFDLNKTVPRKGRL
ncbi:MAG: hypothetical protein WC284_06300 [Candidimonas sp.]